jgi:nitrate reductase / nitrite oxidoreductase, beta subunit
MNVRAHLSVLFHLDKCLGCHTCSVACKNLWTDPRGSEYMWWNNVETRPGTGYPTGWEDQDHFKGGWQRTKSGELKLRLHSRSGALAKLFHNPRMPGMDDYYEPFTFRYGDLFDAAQSNDQPTAIPVSMVTGRPIDIEAGPNWDDDLAGSALYARNDPNLEAVPPEVRARMEAVEQVVFTYLPRICNHCLNPACVAACPSGAIYKRAEDGVVLVNQQQCRGWRMCVSACPYKKVFNNWTTGKSEKCILCFPRVETGQAPGCAHSCVGRIRYMGVLLYDADRVPGAACVDDADLVESMLDTILDPHDPAVAAAAIRGGVEPGWIQAARRSPVYSFVKEWGIALPIHPEYRTMAMMFYVPPLSPIVSTVNEDGLVGYDLPAERSPFELLDDLEQARLPVDYLASLFAAGDRRPVMKALRKMLAVRTYRRRASVDGGLDAATLAMLEAAGTSPREADDIFRLTALAGMDDRFVLPAYNREGSQPCASDPLAHKGGTGLGYVGHRR